jgi:hypothetical protein
MMVARAIIKKSITGNNAFNSIISCILTLIVEFEEAKIFHIKHKFNTYANYWAKLGSHLNEGTIIKNGPRGVLPIPYSERPRSLMTNDKWRCL